MFHSDKSLVTYIKTPTESKLTFDEEGLNMFFEFPELGIAYCVNKQDKDLQISPHSGLHELLRYGFISIKKGSQSEFDRQLRMANQVHRLGIRDILNKPKELVAKLKDNPVVPISSASHPNAEKKALHSTKDQTDLFAFI